MDPRVRAAASASPRSPHRLERIGRYKHTGADSLRVEGSGDRLLRQAQARLSRRSRAAGAAQDPGIRRQFSLRSPGTGERDRSLDFEAWGGSLTSFFKALAATMVCHHINTHVL